MGTKHEDITCRDLDSLGLRVWGLGFFFWGGVGVKGLRYKDEGSGITYAGFGDYVGKGSGREGFSKSWPFTTIVREG